MRLKVSVKVHEVQGPRLPFPPKMAEIAEQEIDYVSATGVLADGYAGILYWIEQVVTTDAGSVKGWHNNAGSGQVVAGFYAAKAPDSKMSNYDPPMEYKNGLYFTITNGAARVCHRPHGKNLTCRATIEYAPGILTLNCRVSVYFTTGTRALVSQVKTLRKSSRTFTSRLTTRKVTSKSLVSRISVVYIPGSTDLVCRVVSNHLDAERDLVVKLTTLRKSSKGLQAQVHVQYIAP
jgi:hypothetical protein